MAAEVEYGMLGLDGTTRGIGTRDENLYAATLKAAKLAWSLRKEAEIRGGSCDAAHGIAGRMPGRMPMPKP